MTQAAQKIRTFITRSKRGHYTATVKVDGQRKFKKNKLTNLWRARDEAAAFIKTLGVPAQAAAGA